MLALDHVKLRVADMAFGGRFLASLGFRLTPSSGAEGRHGRVLLDRSYIEVSPAIDASETERADWSGYFLRTADAVALASTTSGDTFRWRGPNRFQGVDGEWLDTVIAHDGLHAELPLVVQRITPVEVARDWPPSLTTAHPNGVLRMLDVHVVTEQAQALARVLSQACGTEATPPRPNTSLGATECRIPLGAGGVVVLKPMSVGPAATRLSRRGPGVFGVVFETIDLVALRHHLDKSGSNRQLQSSRSNTTTWTMVDADGSAWVGFREQRKA